MSFFNWNEKYSVGVLEMDIQHQKLLEILNEHFEAMSQNKDKEELIKIFTELHDYAKEHFSKEESYMQEYNYPELETQKKEHEFFINKIKSFQDDLQTGKNTLSIDVSIFLKEWLLKHISIEDKKYGNYFKKNGIN